jgi:hypothetical protein
MKENFRRTIKMEWGNFGFQIMNFSKVISKMIKQMERENFIGIIF